MSLIEKYAGMPRAEAAAAIQAAIRASSRDLAELSVAMQLLMTGGELCEFGPLAAEPAPKRDRQIEDCILQASPGPSEPPISRRKLAVRAGYGYNEHFRRAVTALVDGGLLAESTKGVRKPPAKGY